MKGCFSLAEAIEGVGYAVSGAIFLVLIGYGYLLQTRDDSTGSAITIYFFAFLFLWIAKYFVSVMGNTRAKKRR